MPKIFISYRREDSQHQADRLHAALRRHVANPKRDIFIDIDNIPVGVDFVKHLDAKVAECDVLLARPDYYLFGACRHAKNLPALIGDLRGQMQRQIN